MVIKKSERGFQYLEHPVYLDKNEGKERLIIQSSAIDMDYKDSFEKPGSSYLWIGDYHHLNRKDVKQLVYILLNWLHTGKLSSTDVVPTKE